VSSHHNASISSCAYVAAEPLMSPVLYSCRGATSFAGIGNIIRQEQPLAANAR